MSSTVVKIDIFKMLETNWQRLCQKAGEGRLVYDVWLKTHDTASVSVKAVFEHVHVKCQGSKNLYSWQDVANKRQCNMFYNSGWHLSCINKFK